MYRIYALIDPRDNSIKYVGSTRCTIPSRMASHVTAARVWHERQLSQWINSLVAIGLRPRVLQLAVSDTRQSEKKWIRALSDYGLLNLNWNARSAWIPCPPCDVSAQSGLSPTLDVIGGLKRA